MIRILITYDINNDYNYDNMYRYLNILKAKKITESTYEVIIGSLLNITQIRNNLYNITSTYDKVFIVYSKNNNIEYIKVR